MTQIPDCESIVSAYLQEQTGKRIVGTTPSDHALPWVRVTLLGAPNEANSPVEHLIAFMLQLDCYAGSEPAEAQAEANDLARSVRAALADMKGSHGGAVVSGVRFSGMIRLPDTAMEPARERYILTAHVWMHP